MKNNNTNLRVNILFEDKWIFVVEKPSGILSVPFEGSGRTKTVMSILENTMREKGSYSSGNRPFAVHRLDRDTSGVMMFAKSFAARKKIMDSWQQMVSERLYVAVAENPIGKNFLADSGVIDDCLSYNAYNIGYVKKNQLASQTDYSHKKNCGKRRSDKQADSIKAVTHYKIIQRGKTHTFFELSLDTGRKNQIRAHLAAKGYPLAGDKNYLARTNPFSRLALHAKTLSFEHPFSLEQISFEVPEPAEWLKFMLHN